MTAWWALGGYALFLALAFVVRSLLHYRRTGSPGWVRPASALAWACEGLLTLGGAATTAAPVLDLTGALRPLGRAGDAHRAVGIALIGAGILLALSAQRAMGRSWRAGVDPAARTDLVTSGPFALIRNPFYVAMLLAGGGVAVLVPNAIALAGIVSLLLGMGLVVRLVEEPYLRRAHGEAYLLYVSRTGRFLPKVGTRLQQGEISNGARSGRRGPAGRR